MIPPTLEDIEALLEKWVPRLGLEHWSVQLREGGEIEDSIFEIHRHETAPRAVIYVRGWLLKGEWSEEHTLEEINEFYVEKALVHELCHILFHGMGMTMRQFLDDHAAPAVQETLSRCLSNIEEFQVDLLADSLVRSWKDPQGNRMTQVWSKQDRPIEHEWLMQELDDSVQIIPLHEPGHLLGSHTAYTDGETVALNYDWCWCDPKIKEESEWEKPMVTHRDFHERMGMDE